MRHHEKRVNLSRNLLSVIACLFLMGTVRTASASAVIVAFIRETYDAMFEAHEVIHEEMDALVDAAEHQIQNLPPGSTRIVQIVKIQAKTMKRVEVSARKMEARVKKMYTAARKQLGRLDATQADFDSLESEYLDVYYTIRTDVERRKEALDAIVAAAIR